MRRLSVMGAGALVLALAVGATGTAAAGPAKAGSSCPDETLCLWSKKNYAGEKVKITKVGEVSNKLAEKMNNDASSLKNKFELGGDLYDKKDGGGDCFVVSGSTNYPKLKGFNDRASSSSILAPSRAKRVCKRSGAPSHKGAGKKCANGALCVWTGKNYKGTKYKVTKIGKLVKLPAKVNNKVSSAKNRWENRAFLYDTKGGGPQTHCMAPGENEPNLADFFDEFNNDASSALLDENPLACPP